MSIDNSMSYDIEYLGTEPQPIHCPVCGRCLPNDEPCVSHRFSKIPGRLFKPGLWRTQGEPHPLYLLAASPDSEAWANGIAGMTATCTECADVFRSTFSLHALIGFMLLQAKKN